MIRDFPFPGSPSLVLATRLLYHLCPSSPLFFIQDPSHCLDLVDPGQIFGLNAER